MSKTTLRDLSGLDASPASPSEATLILIDYQNTYTRGVMELTGWEAALDAGAALLERARAAGAKVIHVINDGGEEARTTSGPRSAGSIRGWPRSKARSWSSRRSPTGSSEPTWATMSTPPATRTSSSPDS